jgi:hypothetical protein
MIEGFAPGTAEDEFGDPPARSSLALGNAEVGHDAGDRRSSADAGGDGGDLSFGKSGKPTERHDEHPSILDAVAGVLAAPDPQTFIGGLVGELSRLLTAEDFGESSIRTLLSLLGAALADALNEELVFQEIVDALERTHLRSEPVDGSVAIVAAFLARIVAGSSLRSSPETPTAEAAGLVHAAAQVVREALESDRARAWHMLPQMASTIARRAAQRRLPIASLAAALPRLWAQLGPGPQDISTPGPDRAWPGMAAQPRLMVLNGPVEIVTLGR